MVTPKKKLGQHFLTDENIAQKIVNALDFSSAEAVLEIGPGTGVLTQWLKDKEVPFYLIEVDTESIEYLNATYPTLTQNLLEQDFLKLDFDTLPMKSFSIIGNLPYNISSQIFFKILDAVERIPQIVCMIQYEVAQRISSPPNNKQYGILSVLLQAYYDIEFLFKVPPQVFNPPPKVDSGVIRLTRRSDYETSINCDKQLFKNVVKTGFNQRRKMLSNSLKPILGDKKIDNHIMNKRPEQLGVEDFVSLTRLIESV
ncbi:dimethyladenosine transferase [Balneicella halophila]|uniref:Ribosomal RNA small subunit methyltransferase A n=1 Tax=Balneicella halophila TaxID=1537566 RepID=A0A7L4UNQ3_BALHA|nr:16S rRNA (adenine(1518)-N(6)/adenine(1519)-N(6))-dimethyltransferase RsmA [Balneicella halophila]PVX50718.1 dimethyladenosine transferase [Balneicella halophila]